MKVFTIEYDDEAQYERSTGLTAVASSLEAAIRFLREHTAEALATTNMATVPFVPPHVGPVNLGNGYHRWDWDVKYRPWKNDDMTTEAHIVWRIDEIEVKE